MISYVKFLKGTQKAYDKLPCKSEDTLYFIYNEDDSVGALYLGGIKLSDGPITDISATVDNLSLAKDDNNTLYLKNYGQRYYEWVNGEYILRTVGDEYSWKEGLEPRVTYDTEQKNYVLAWYEPAATNEELKEQIAEVPTQIANALAEANYLSYAVVASKEDIDLTKINCIYLVGDGISQYSEYMVINGALEKIGDWEIDLKDYAKQEEVDSALASLEQKIQNNATNLSIIEDNLDGMSYTLNSHISTVAELNEIVKSMESDIGFVKDTADSLKEFNKEIKTITDRVETLEQSVTWTKI